MSGWAVPWIVSPSGDAIKFNVPGHYLRKYGIWNLPKQCFWSYFCNDDYRASIFTHEIEEQTCYGTHFTQNNGGRRFKLPFEKVYQPYNGPTIRKFQ